MKSTNLKNKLNLKLQNHLNQFQKNKVVQNLYCHKHRIQCRCRLICNIFWCVYSIKKTVFNQIIANLVTDVVFFCHVKSPKGAMKYNTLDKYAVLLWWFSPEFLGELKLKLKLKQQQKKFDPIHIHRTGWKIRLTLPYHLSLLMPLEL